MKIEKVVRDKKKYLALLMLADEQESMIDRYLERGTMYLLRDGTVRAECVVTDEGGGILELKNIAVVPGFQRKGYGKALIEFLVRTYAERYTAVSYTHLDVYKRQLADIPNHDSFSFYIWAADRI